MHSFSAVATTASASGTLGVLFEGGDTFTKIDDVSLTATVIPESASLALLGLAATVFLRRRK